MEGIPWRRIRSVGRPVDLRKKGLGSSWEDSDMSFQDQEGFSSALSCIFYLLLGCVAAGGTLGCLCLNSFN